MIKKFTIREEGISLADWVKDTQKAVELLESVTFKAGQVARDSMANIISAKKKRKPSKGTLEKSIRVTQHKKKGYYLAGVGRISLLNTVAPYWKIINWGGVVPQSIVGVFGNNIPPMSQYAGTGVGTEVFHPQTPGFLMIPKNPIPAFRYITKGVRKGKKYWDAQWKFWQKDYENNLKSHYKKR